MRKLQRATRKKKRGGTIAQQQLPDEIVWEILSLLPVKPLHRFKSVCKAWRATIADPAFIRAHLRRRSAANRDRDEYPAFLISPNNNNNTAPDSDSSGQTAIRFYRWKPPPPQQQQGASAAAEVEHLHTKDFGNDYGGFKRVRALAHCDGLVLAPTDTALHLFNPATRDALTLPDSDLNNLRMSGSLCCYCAGLGLDPRSGMYKVVQAFCRPVEEVPAYYLLEHPDYTEDTVPAMGMEVFTVAGYGGEWREIEDDLPYPIKRHQTGVSVNGFIFWRIDRRTRQRRVKQRRPSPPPPPRGVLCLSLADEEFSVTKLPDSLDPAFDDAFVLDELRGRELCLSARTAPEAMTIWTMSIEDGMTSPSWSPWERRYAIRVSDHLFRPMAILHGGSGIVLRREEGGDSRTLHRYDLVTSELTTLCRMDRVRYQQQGRGRGARKWNKSLASFDVRPYTESLVRVTREPRPLVHPDKAGPCLIDILRAELLWTFRNGTLAVASRSRQ